ncbi:DUF349 domain-containing protein [Corynebacterium sp. TAE3-ERU12]|uniref:DUF349 domain-containing protein n=1 Tax=Corynebacterium sp. TAE3-ERU12 TaxID=2849491 RepID=UPI001C490862|nr:DUF349 domain-containing protein [Corynebacterium sp. TAE3-ERU12]MBV7295281.1 DUF349 domain-containing protein [Corynebacterium sp. TAE3-ERU12]
MSEKPSSPTPGATPGPKPGPRPGPRPGARPARPAARPAAVVQVPAADPSKWGRVDEDGTVYVITGDGERVVGSWQAGDAKEALTHFGKKFDDMATEVVVLEERLHTHPDEATAIAEKATTLRAGLSDANVVGDLNALDKRLDAVIAEAGSAKERAQEEKTKRRAEAIARREELAAEAETIAEESTEWKAAGDRLRDILEEWRTIRGIDRETDDALWKRYSKARDAFNRRRGAHFAELDRTRAAAKRTKEDIIAEAEKLQDSTDWAGTASAYRELMKRWKAAGRAPRDVDDKLWAQFKAAQDHFFAARNAVNAQRDKEFEANAQAKDALIAEFEPRIQPEKNLDAARQELNTLQEKWDAIGFVPRDRVREFEQKIGALEKRVADAADSHWRRNDPEAQARVAQFEQRAADFEQQAKQLEAKGRAKKAAEARESAAQWREWADAARQALESL